MGLDTSTTMQNKNTVWTLWPNTRGTLSASNVVKAATGNIIIVALPKSVRHVKVNQLVDDTSLLGKV